MADASEIAINGQWKWIKSENLDAYLKAIGIGFMKRKLAASAGFENTEIEVEVKGDSYTVRIYRELNTGVLENIMADGKECTVYNAKGESATHVSGSFENGVLTQTFDNQHGKTTSTRKVNEEGILVWECNFVSKKDVKIEFSMSYQRTQFEKKEVPKANTNIGK